MDGTIRQEIALVEGDELVLDGFRESDPEVVAIAKEAEDVASITHRCLAMGARALRLAQVSVDSAVVERQFAAMTMDFKAAVSQAVDRITDTTEGLLSVEDGELHQTLHGWRDDVAELLDTKFDPESKSSVLSKLDGILANARDEQVRDVRALLSPDNQESPIGRFLASVQGQVEDLRLSVEKISTELAVSATRAEMEEKTAGKGFTFEDLLHERVLSITSVHGDIAEQVGRISGASGNQVGDEVVTLNPSDSAGREVRYVLEAKARRLSLKGILDELAVAMTNREAQAGIAVFSRDGLSPVAEPFQPYGDRAVVVLDKDEPDALALRLACAWARWVVRRDAQAQADGVDGRRVEELVGEARRALGRVSAIKRAHSTARKRIDDAAGEVDSLAQDVEKALDQICIELNE